MARFASTLLVLLALLLTTTAAYAQASSVDNPAMADGLYQSGKIYVVVAAVVIIVAGLLVYLISLDRKVSRLEKEIMK